MPPLISILLPVWNAAATLPAACGVCNDRPSSAGSVCLSMTAQTIAHLACARWFAAQDTRFTVVATSHQGLVAALHTGLAHCRGRFVARMDADDLMHRQRLSLQLRMLAESPHLTAAGCHVRLFPRHGLPEAGGPTSAGSTASTLQMGAAGRLCRMSLAHPT